VKLDWERWNHVLIPVPTAERRRRSKPLSPLTKRFIELAFSLTGAGQVFLVGGALVGALAIALPTSRLPFLFGTVIGFFVVSIAARRAFPIRNGRAHLVQSTRVTVGEPLDLRVVVEAEHEPHELTVRGPFLPWFARYEGPKPTLGRERGTPGFSAHTSVRFTRRSDLFLGPFVVTRRMPLDLVGGPPIQTEAFRIKVVPRPADVKRLELATARDGRVDARRGMRRDGLTHLAGVREYRPGDRIRDLDVRTWAKTGVPAVRECEDPEMSRAIVLFDTHGNEGDSFEAAVSLVAGVASYALGGGISLELLVIGETLHPLSTGRGRGALPLVLDALAVAEPTSRFDRERLLARVVPHLERASSVVFVTTRWDEARAAVAETLARKGIAPRVFVVEEKTRAALPSYARSLTPRMVTRGGLEL
jgi:uncharacterized protein (DUF58 family)